MKACKSKDIKCCEKKAKSIKGLMSVAQQAKMLLGKNISMQVTRPLTEGKYRRSHSDSDLNLT